MPETQDDSDQIPLFIERWVSDRLAGRRRSLIDYLTSFPGAESAVARCFGELAALETAATAPEPATLTGSPTDAAAHDGGAEFDADVIAGRYRLVRELGRGGQAVVFLAHDVRFDRPVALKVLEGVGPSFEAAAKRLKREAEIVAKLDHPGICAVYDAGFARGRGFVAMRFVEGETFAARLKRRRAAGGPPTKEEIRATVAFFAAAATALHAAHEAGFVHRDIKPANLMATTDELPVILDFGLAHDATGDGATLTATGDVFGTPAYMAPEQVRGAAGRPDRRIDVFALGAALYEGLTLRRAFDGPTREAVMAAILEMEPADPRRDAPSITRDLATVVATALAKEPGRRYATAAAFAEDLARVLRDEPVEARRLGPLDRLARFARRRPAAAALVVVVVAALAGGLWLTETKNAELSLQVEENTRLSDVRLPRDLADWDDRLFPLSPALIPGPQGIDAWLTLANATLARRPLHAAALQRIGAADSRRADASTPGGTSVESVALSWRRDLLTELLKDLDALPQRIAGMQERRARCLSIAEDSLTTHADDWARTVAEIAADPRYGGLRLAPQLGLVPLGRDRTSGLFEFCDLRSGTLVPRDPTTGRLKITAEHGIVYVLVPGGRFTMGALPPDGDDAAGDPNIDPNAGRFERPLVEVKLDAFFLGKFELTTAQWRRGAGTIRAAPDGFDQQPLHPISYAAWRECVAILGKLGAKLPTEAQWEYAARAGTTTPWWTGVAASSLVGAANLADRSAEALGMFQAYDSWLDDGFAGPAVIGRFKANAFGLHDVVGNVAEWCRDEFLTYEATPEAGDGFRPGQGVQPRIYRGGSYESVSGRATSANREALRANSSAGRIGVRPFRAFDG